MRSAQFVIAAAQTGHPVYGYGALVFFGFDFLMQKAGVQDSCLSHHDKLLIERSQRFMAPGRTLAENEDESAIIAMLLDDYYQRTLHAPVPQSGGATVSTGPGHAWASRHRRRSRR